MSIVKHHVHWLQVSVMGIARVHIPQRQTRNGSIAARHKSIRSFKNYLELLQEHICSVLNSVLGDDTLLDERKRGRGRGRGGEFSLSQRKSNPQILCVSSSGVCSVRRTANVVEFDTPRTRLPREGGCRAGRHSSVRRDVAWRPWCLLNNPNRYEADPFFRISREQEKQS
jgi:hypothetical protein